MWVTPATPGDPNAAAIEPYTWEMMFDILSAGVVGIACCAMSSSMHGRDRGGVLLALALVIIVTSLAVPDVGKFELQVRTDTSEPVPEKSPPTQGRWRLDV